LLVKATGIKVILVLVVLGQLAFLLAPHFGPDPYRRIERRDAFLAWKQLGTPEAKAAFDAECALADRHQRLTAFALIGGFLLADGLLCVAFWRFGKHDIRKTMG
jgi:hypothetical protein